MSGEMTHRQRQILDLITRTVHAIEDDLRGRGHATARVQAVREPVPSGDLVLRLEVEPGPLHRIAGVRFEGLEGTREAWAERIAGLEPGGLFRDQNPLFTKVRVHSYIVFELYTN